MSDAFSDIVKDEQRSKNIHSFLKALVFYLEGDLPAKEVLKRAEIASGGSRGFFSSPVDFVTDLEKELKQLKRGTEKTWAKTLFRYRDSDLFFHLCTLSPWSLLEVACVEYGMGFARITKYPERHWIGEEYINEIIYRKNWFIYDCDDYLIVFDSDNHHKVFWIGNSTGYKCKDGMFRSLKKPRRKNDWTGSGTEEQREKYCR
jgi:hypothetical protein